MAFPYINPNHYWYKQQLIVINQQCTSFLSYLLLIKISEINTYSNFSDVNIVLANTTLKLLLRWSELLNIWILLLIYTYVFIQIAYTRMWLKSYNNLRGKMVVNVIARNLATVVIVWLCQQTKWHRKYIDKRPSKIVVIWRQE